MNNHHARVDRLAREKVSVADTCPTREELAVVIEKMDADDSYQPPWTSEQVEAWIAAIEADLAP